MSREVGTAQVASRFGFLDQVRELPSLPQILVRVSRVASDPTSSVANLADVILKDQAITLKVLKIVNSANYAVCSQRITTVSKAVVMLGFESVRAITLGVGAFQLLSALERGGEVLERFWTHAVSTAVISQDLATMLGCDGPEEAFVAGLLHDAGKLVLAEHRPDEARAVYAIAQTGMAGISAEMQAFGVHHQEVGEELARRWDLPEILRKAIGRHHRSASAPPVEQLDKIAFLVGVADSLAHAFCEDSTHPRDLAARMARLLRKPVGSVAVVLEKIPDKIREFAGFFEIQLEDLKTYTRWVESQNQRLQEAFGTKESDRRKAERQQSEMAALRETNALLLEGVSMESVTGRVLRGTREAAGARRALFARISGDPPIIRAEWGQGDITPSFMDAFRFPVAEGGSVAEAVISGRAIHVFDARLPYFRRLLSPRESKALDAPAFAVIPVIVKGAPVGIVYADRQEGDEPFSDEEVETLQSLGNLIGLAASPK